MFLTSQCDRLSDNVNNVLELVRESSIDRQNVPAAEASLAKAIAPKFEIVFAGAFSAGKRCDPASSYGARERAPRNRC